MTYHTNTSRISKSGLDLINRAPAHYYERYLNPAANPQKETPALVIGSAVHCAVLEPEEFGKRYAVGPRVDRRTKAGKEEWEAFLQTSAGFIQLDSETATLCERIMEAVRNFPYLESHKINPFCNHHRCSGLSFVVFYSNRIMCRVCYNHVGSRDVRHHFLLCHFHLH